MEDAGRSGLHGYGRVTVKVVCIVECETPRPLWLPYVEVREIGAATERARELGASVLLEPREGPAGWRSVVTAGAGGEVAFWQPKECA